MAGAVSGKWPSYFLHTHTGPWQQVAVLEQVQSPAEQLVLVLAAEANTTITMPATMLNIIFFILYYFDLN